MARKYDTVEDRLADSDSWVRDVFHKLEAMCRDAAKDIRLSDDAKREGRKFYVNDNRRPFCRVDPKQHYIGIGYHKDIRSDVDRWATLRRDRTDMVWIFVNEGDDLGAVVHLVHKAIKAASYRKAD
jgi:hypothetical protein